MNCALRTLTQQFSLVPLRLPLSWSRHHKLRHRNLVADRDSIMSKWTSHVDTGSGRTYYANVETKETSWEKPADYVYATCNAQRVLGNHCRFWAPAESLRTLLLRMPAVLPRLPPTDRCRLRKSAKAGQSCWTRPLADTCVLCVQAATLTLALCVVWFAVLRESHHRRHVMGDACPQRRWRGRQTSCSGDRRRARA